MPVEAEKKYLNQNPDKVKEALLTSGASLVSRVFERNTVYDDSGMGLKNRGMLLRVRLAGGSCVLTFKRPLEEPEPADVKAREEIETRVDDPEAIAAIIQGLGFTHNFIYEKVRETWRLGEALICLDTLPFGFFVEIEAPAESIDRIARRLGLPDDCASTDSYHELNRLWRQDQGLETDSSFVFDDEHRLELIKEFGEDAEMV